MGATKSGNTVVITSMEMANITSTIPSKAHTAMLPGQICQSKTAPFASQQPDENIHISDLVSETGSANVVCRIIQQAKA
jgi:hypothetical protein